MKITVLGSGNGGCAVAFDWAKAGHDVFMFDFEKFPKSIDAIAKNGGIFSEGQLQGFAKIQYAGHDIEKVVKKADLIFVVGPAYSTQPFGEACRPYLEKGQIVIVCPSSCGGSIVFKNALDLDIASEDIVIAESSTLPYAVRLMEPGKIHVYLKLKGGLLLAALPSKYTNKVITLTQGVYPCMVAAKNVLQTTLQNANPVIHPAVTLLNAGLIERSKGDFFFYEDGVTPAVGNLMETIDKERIAIGEKLGFEVIPDPVLGMQQGYMQENTYDAGYSKAEGFKGIQAQSSLDYRYFHEDVGYGLVFMSELGRQVGVATPTMDAVIHIVSAIMKKDYRNEKKRTMETLGLGGYSLGALNDIL
ncbi:NAD/NADP octopine/nopaline dehydrogenase family protein [Clostridiaceae bacterium 35-E11]